MNERLGEEPGIDLEVLLSDARAENAKLRVLLAASAAGPLMYRDDGELQDSSVHPYIDFKRDDPDTIQAKLIKRAQDQFVNQVATIDYTNWRGERNIRIIKPIRVFWGANEFHKEPQWLLQAMDMQKNALRTFALKDIHNWI